MSLVIVWVGSLRNSSQVQFFSLSTSPVIENVQSVSGVRGVGPAERTGKSLTRYWPGGRRPACPWSLGRPRKAREMKVTLEAYAQNAADVPSRRRRGGSAVRDLRPGDRVVVAAITPDWGDVASQAGHSSQSGQPLGGWKFSNTKDGVFAEYFHVNAADANLAHIPSSVPDEAAVYCADMITTGLMGAENADIPIGGTVAVFGQGPVGLMATAGARLRGAGLIIAIEAVAKRQNLARHFGRGVVVDYSTGDELGRAFEIMDKKLDGVVKPLITFD